MSYTITSPWDNTSITITFNRPWFKTMEEMKPVETEKKTEPEKTEEKTEPKEKVCVTHTETEEQMEEQTVKCKSCQRTYNCQNLGPVETLNQHLQRNLSCKKWMDFLDSDDKFANSIQIKLNNEKTIHLNKINSKTKCTFCDKEYCNSGNLTKHLINYPLCNRFHNYNIIKSWFDNNDFDTVPNTVPSSLIHIIWNLFLTDKISFSKQDTQAQLKDNNISYIICILPDKLSQSEFLPLLQIDTITYDDHEPVLNDKILELYKKCYEKIMVLQKERKNTLLFCNNGYQRSLPFLCYYLINYHTQEVPNLDRALEIILSQVDKLNYLKIKDETKKSLYNLLDETGNKIFH